MSFELLGKILQGLPMTLLLTAAGLSIGMILGLPLMAASNSRWWPVRLVSASAVQLLRGVPPVVWLFILMFGVGTSIVTLSPLTVAIIGLGAISTAYLSEIYRGSLGAIHSGQAEASAALGMSRIDSFRLILAPQLARVSIPAIATFGIGLLKDSSIAFSIGVPEMMYRAGQQKSLTGQVLEPFLTAGAIYIVVSVIAGYGTRVLDAHLRRKVKQ